jgi:polyisoprenoid-binding protein YceI
MKTLTFAASLCMVSVLGYSQKYVAENALITFFSDATLEDIKAENKKGASIFNVATSDIAFSIPINEFQFDKALMQEHFNEKYMETDKYPKASFQGKVSGFDATKTGIQSVSAAGKLTIHGVSREVTVPGTLEVKSSKIQLETKFIVKLEDYQVAIPKLMWQNIAEQVEVSVAFTYKPQ